MTLKEKAVGVWTLVSYQSQDEEGNIIYPFGKDATGFIMYHPEGYMSAQLMRLVIYTKGQPKKWQKLHLVI